MMMSFFYTISLVFFSVVLLYIPCHLLFFSGKKPTTVANADFPLPPGKTGFPVIGESLDFFFACSNGRPESFIQDRMAKYSSKVFKTHLYGQRLAVFCGPSGNKFLFSNEDKLVRKWLPSSIKKIAPSSAQTSPIEEAHRLKKLFLGFLKHDTLRNHVRALDRIARSHFADAWENKARVFVHPLATYYAVSIVCNVSLSVQDPRIVSRFAELLKTFSNGVFSIPVNLPGTRYNRAVKAAELMRREIMTVMKQRRVDLEQGKASPRQDALSHMLSASIASGELNELNIADMIVGMLIGSRDSTASTCCTVVKYLAQEPEIYHRVYMEQMEIVNSKDEDDDVLNWDDLKKMKYSWNVVCEAWRISPPEQGTFREAIVDFSYDGFSIPKGWKLYWNAYSSHLDPKLFPEPRKFDPSRFEGSGPPPFAYVPFGGGPRMCPGQELARVAILVFVHHIVKRFKWHKLIQDESNVVYLVPVPKKGLPIQLFPHDKA